MNAPRIVVLMITKSKMHAAIMESLASRQRSIFPNAEIVECIADRPGGRIDSDVLRLVSQEDVDVVVTVGNYLSKLVTDEFNGRRYPLPTVFYSLGKAGADFLAEQRATGADYLTGVYPEHQPAYLPLQMVLRHYPNAKQIFLPYRSDAKMGRMEYEVQCVQEYCVDRKIETVAFPIDKKEGLDTLRESISATDLTVCLEGGLPGDAVYEIEQLCEALQKPFVGNGHEALKESAVYSFEEDARFMGAKVAEVCKQIVVDKKSPIDIEPYIVKHARLISSGDEASQGVFLAKDVHAFSEEHQLYKDIPVRNLGIAMPTDIVLGMGLYFMMSWKCHQSKDFLYFIQKYDSVLDDESVAEATKRRTFANGLDQLTVLDDEYAHELWLYAKEHGHPFPPCIVVSIGDKRAPNWHHIVREKSGTLIHVSLPAPDPVIQLRMLYEAAPHIKKVTLFIKENIPNPSPFLAKRLEHVQAFCATHNLELRVVGGPGIIDMYDERKKYISPDQTDACLFYHDLMDGRHASHLIDLCRERGIVLCAGGISFGQIAPICYGVDTLKLREYLVEIAQTLSRGETPEKDEVIFTHSEIYAACVNARICKKMDMKTSSFAAQQFVDTLHEKSIGPAMNASERADGSFERLAKAEKEYSARAQKLFDEAYRKLNG